MSRWQHEGPIFKPGVIGSTGFQQVIVINITCNLCGLEYNV